MLTRGADIGLSRIDHASLPFFFTWRWLSGPRVYRSSRTIGSGRKLRGGCAHIGSWARVSLFDKRGYCATNGPSKTMLWVLPPPIVRRSFQLLSIAIFLACCLAAERRLAVHFTPFGGAFF